MTKYRWPGSSVKSAIRLVLFRFSTFRALVSDILRRPFRRPLSSIETESYWHVNLMLNLEDRVVTAIIEKFDALPTKSKPRTLTNGIQEWVPLSGIVTIGDDESITCLALGTGMKCLPSSKPSLLDCGLVLHDWHAEILAIRAFNHFLLQECHRLASCANYKSPILRWRQECEVSEIRGLQPFNIHDGLRVMMYCSEAPCGDASMELVMEAQDDPTPWPVAVSDEGASSNLLGRGSFSQLGIVRRKPCKQARLLDIVRY